MVPARNPPPGKRGMLDLESQPQFSLAEEIAARPPAARIEPTDPAVAPIRQRNTAAFSRAYQAAPAPEAAGA